MDILNMPVAQIKESGAMIKKNEQNGQYPEPVKLILSIRRNCNHLKPRFELLPEPEISLLANETAI